MLIDVKISLSLIVPLIFISSTVISKKVPYDDQQDNPGDGDHDCPSALGCYDSESILGNFSKASIATDANGCAVIGKNLLIKGGSAADAAIGVLLCMGLVIPQSMGIGGGCIMTIYDENTRNSMTINGREIAPAAAHKDMMKGNSTLASTGGLAIGVPGELSAYQELHQRYGKLSWAELFEETIKLAQDGFQVGKHLAHALNEKKDIISQTDLRHVFINQETNQVFKEGETMKRLEYAATLQLLARNGIQEFYSGNLMKQLVAKIQSVGGIITEQDFKNYKVVVKPPIPVDLRNGYEIYATRPPGSGTLLSFALHILSPFTGLYPHEAKKSTEKAILYYHRLIETFKYTFARRFHIADEDFENMDSMIRNLTEFDTADQITDQIDDNMTYEDPSHYGYADQSGIGVDDHGTASMSVIDEHGLAISVTTTVNLYFGSKVIDLKSGIILNSQMDDFNSPNITNSFGLIPATDHNHIEPGKRPMSSMSSSIITDKVTGKINLVIGAEGGSQITTALAQTITRTLYFEDSIKTAIDAPRLHQQLFPNYTTYEPGFPENLLDGLRKKGHRFEELERQSCVTGVHRGKYGMLYANTDYFKGGSVDGY